MKYYSYKNFFFRSLDKEKGLTLAGSIVVVCLFLFLLNKKTTGELTYWFLWVCVAVIIISTIAYIYNSFKIASKKNYIKFLALGKADLMETNINYTDNIIQLLGHMQSISDTDQSRKMNFVELCNYLDLLNLAEDNFEEAKAVLIQEEKYELIKDLEKLREYSGTKQKLVSIHDEIEENADVMTAMGEEILNLIQEIKQQREKVTSEIDWITKKLEKLNW